MLFNVAPAGALGKGRRDALTDSPTATTGERATADKQTHAKAPRGDPSAVLAELGEFEAIADAFAR